MHAEGRLFLAGGCCFALLTLGFHLLVFRDLLGREDRHDLCVLIVAGLCDFLVFHFFGFGSVGFDRVDFLDGGEANLLDLGGLCFAQGKGFLHAQRLVVCAFFCRGLRLLRGSGSRLRLHRYTGDEKSEDEEKTFHWMDWFEG